MLKITYIQKREDFVMNQLFASSKLETVRKSRTRSRIRVSIVYILFSLYLFTINAPEFGIGFLIFAVVWYLFYPLFTANAYKRTYTKQVDEIFANRYNQPVTVVFANEYIGWETVYGEAKLYNTAVESIDEITDYCTVKFKSGETLFVPLNQLTEKTEVLAVLRQLAEKNNIPYQTDLNWKWK
ncbi:MAG: hypothetical protein PHT07_00090 [Paludibacter sp.]|nr:hypothetical protein [Paludibacter sp.]